MREETTTRPFAALPPGRAQMAVPRRWPLMAPMPEAWDDTPYDGPVCVSPRPQSSLVEAALAAGLFGIAASEIDDGRPLARLIMEIGMVSWDDWLIDARRRLDGLRLYEAENGHGSAIRPDHPLARTIKAQHANLGLPWPPREQKGE